MVTLSVGGCHSGVEGLGGLLAGELTSKRGWQRGLLDARGSAAEGQRHRLPSSIFCILSEPRLCLTAVTWTYRS